ncbi:MAG: glutamate-5-semialdehyde dehydrogenase, partial [Rhodanobacteraceae bacterium]
MPESVREAALACKLAAQTVAELDKRAKTALLHDMANELAASAALVLSANAKDLAAARNSGVSTALLDRLALTPQRLQDVVKG